MTLEETNGKIAEYCQRLQDKLIAKNIAYNNSLQNPINIFHQGGQIDGICSRIDDKLNRIKQAGLTSDTEDSINDIIGYLIHLEIALNK